VPTDKEQFIAIWAPSCGLEEAEHAWNVKVNGAVMKPSMVMNDIEPYRSMIDGSIITSRSRHREHLRDHDCIEVGNETKYLGKKPLESPPGLKEALIRAVYEKRR